MVENSNFHPDGAPAISITIRGFAGRFSLAVWEVRQGTCAHESDVGLVYAALRFVKLDEFERESEFVAVGPADEFDAETRAFSAPPDLMAKLVGGICLADGLWATATRPYPPEYGLTGPGADFFLENHRRAIDLGILEPTSTEVWPALPPRWADAIDRRLRGEISGNAPDGVALISAASAQTILKGATYVQ